MDIRSSDTAADDNGMASSRPPAAEEERLVKVTWRDILQCSGWEKAEDVKTPQFISIGWLISRNGQEIKIATTLDYNDAFDDAKDVPKPVPYGITAFPAGCVDDIEFIEYSVE